MRRVAFVSALVIALGSWLVSGPGGLTVRELLACSDAHPMPHMGATHHAPTRGGPCVCDQNAPGLTLAASVAVPTSPPAPFTLVAPPATTTASIGVPLPPSPSFPPTAPPPEPIG